MKVKAYEPALGIAIDSTFAAHVEHCQKCQRYDATKPATLALLCLEGSILWKQIRERKKR